MNSTNSVDLSALSAEQKRQLLAQLLAKKAQTEGKTPLRSADSANIIPLSFAQQRLWFIHQLQLAPSVYTIPAALRLQGSLNADILHRCLNEIVVRHEILRTQFVATQGSPSQRILPQLTIDLPIVDLSIPDLSVHSLSADELNSQAGLEFDKDAHLDTQWNTRLETQWRSHLKTLIAQPFDLETEPLLRCQLLKLSETDHILAVAIHHIVADYWSLKILIKEIALLYRAFSLNQPSVLTALPIQYADYASWQQSSPAVQLQAQLSYWLKQLANPPAVLQLPTDRPRPAVQSFRGARRSFSLSAELSQKITALAQQSQATLFMTLLAAFQVLLYRYSGQSDILVGSTVSNRDRAETKDLIGLFVNNLVFRANVVGDQSFQQLLQQIKAVALEAYTHQDVPFEQVVDALQIERQLSYNALFQVMFILHNTPSAAFSLPGLAATAIPLDNSAARFDLSLDMYENEAGLTGVFEYTTDLFEASTIDRLITHFENLLTALVAHPESPIASLPMLSSAEYGQLQAWNQTSTTLSPCLAHELVENQAKQRPGAIALSVESDSVKSGLSPTDELTYEQLNQLANQLAHYLCEQGAGPGCRIALALNRSAELVIALLAVLKLGGTYIPLDPAYPTARLQQVLQDAAVSFILECHQSLSLPALALDVSTLGILLDIGTQADAIAQHSTENLSVQISLEDIAYIIYTSGSTGIPKGVPIRHRSLVNLLASMAKAPGITEKDMLLAVTTVAFDIATLELLLPLSVGAKLAIASAATAREGDRLMARLADGAITIMQATPATWRLLVEMGWQGSPRLKILCGGEALDLSLAQQLLCLCGELWNMYGPTETTIWSSATRIDNTLLSSGFVPIGGPIDNTQFHILDSHHQPTPIGVPGELYIGGEGLSPGYLNRPELTAERFVHVELEQRSDASQPTAPQGLQPTHTTLYKTSDQVRYCANGRLEYLGRIDYQIKLRGFRIEPGDIEAVLNDHPDIEQSLVVLWHDSSGKPQSDPPADLQAERQADSDLIAYCKLSGDVITSDHALQIREYVRQQLPSYMVPSACILLAEFPLTPNGKIDRQALPEPSQKQLTGQSAGQFINQRQNNTPLAPQTQSEQRLAGIWADLFKVSHISTCDNFFELGGHSLLAARVMARIQSEFGLSVPLRSLFENPTLSAFAAIIDQALERESPAVDLIQPIARTQPLPLSYAQQRQWVLAQLEPENPAYNIPAALKIDGDFSLPVLEASLALLCQRHEGLRSYFRARDGEATLELLPADTSPAVTPNISYRDAKDNNLCESQIRELLIATAREPFDLTVAPLMRVQVICTGEQSHIVSLVLHHIIADAESVSLLLREVVAVYGQMQAQKAVALAPLLTQLPIQYVDYAAWQRDFDHSQQLNYWQQQLANLPPLLALPTDYPRPAIQQFEGECHRFTLNVAQTTALKQLAHSHNATLFMTLMAAFQWLLHRYSGATDVVVGTPVSHRPQASLEKVLGMFVNTLVLRGDFSQALTFAELLAQVRERALAAYAHQDVPFEQVIEALNVPRNWSYSPLFQVMFVWQAAKSEAIAPLENLTWSPIVIDNNTTKVDLTLSMTEEKTAQGDRLSGKFEYRCDLFKAGTIEAMADAFATLLAAVSQNPEQPLSALKWVSERQRQQIQQWNETTRDYPAEQTLHQLFEQQAVRSPQAPALITATQALSYQQVNNRTNQLAQQLQRLGVCPEMRVGICLDRSADLIVAILATLKAGGAYVPLDPAYPHSRLAYIVEDAQISVLLTQSAYQALMPSVPHRILLDSQTSFSQVASQTSICSDQSEIESSVTDGADRPPTESAQSHNLAYIIYTSGSTGQPKGVAIEHRSPVALVQWAREAFSPEQLSGVLAATSVCFDLSIFEIFVPLSVGGSVILAEDVLQLPTLPASCQVTLINTVPTAIAELLRINGIPQSVTTINLAGEPIPATLVKQLYALASVQKVFNLYGPSEDTTYSTYSLLSPDDAIVPIGRPIANTQIYLLDANQNLVPIGMPGELYLGGSGLARGYWNQAQMTSERFISSPYAEDPSYLYKTGDLARYRPAGQLEFLGRIDQQVKVRGFRIELGEIESALLAHAQVAQAAAMLWHDPQNNRRLVAYAVLTNCAEDIVFNQALSPLSETFELLQRHLKTILPSYMLPALLVPLEALPLLPNGKINRKALFEFTPTLSAPTLKEAIDETTLALSPSEQILVAVWQALLSQPVGIHDNFFELGGDSILAIQASAQAQQSGLYFSARDLFQHSTISQLAAVATQQSPATGQQSPIVGAVPLTPTQHWFFEQNLTAPHHWNQAVLLTVKQALQPDILAQALRGLMRHHDALRAVFQPPVADAAASYDSADSLWTQFYREPSDVVPLKVIKRTVEDVAQLNAIITAEAKAAQTSFNLEQGPLLQIVYYDLQTPTGNERRLLIVCHHLLIDGVSWRILLNDLQHLYQQLSQQPQVEQTQQEQPLSYTVAQLPPKTMSCQQWINYLTTADFVSELPYWESIVAAELPPLPQDFSLDSTNNNVMATAETHSVALSTQQTHRLLKELPKGYSVRVDDILLAALLLALQPWAGNSLRISLEGHGRLEEHNLSRTVGWLTAIYPVLLSIPPDADLAADFSETIKSVKETLRGVPSQGVGYGALRYLQGRSLLAETPIRFNYLGQSDQLFSADGWLQVATEATGAARSPQDKRDVLLEINAIVVGGQLKLHWTYSRQLHAQATISRWASAYLSQLEALIDHCLSIETDLGYSPSDFPQMGLSQGELDDLLANLGGETR